MSARQLLWGVRRAEFSAHAPPSPLALLASVAPDGFVGDAGLLVRRRAVLAASEAGSLQRILATETDEPRCADEPEQRAASQRVLKGRNIQEEARPEQALGAKCRDTGVVGEVARRGSRRGSGVGRRDEQLSARCVDGLRRRVGRRLLPHRRCAVGVVGAIASSDCRRRAPFCERCERSGRAGRLASSCPTAPRGGPAGSRVRTPEGQRRLRETLAWSRAGAR